MKDKLIQAFTNLGDSVIAAVPKVLVGILLIVGALLVAKLIERGLRYLLAKVRFDSLVGKVGVDRALQRLGVRQELTILIPRLAYFLVLLLLVRTAVDALGLTAISSAIGTFSAIFRTSSPRFCCSFSAEPSASLRGTRWQARRRRRESSLPPRSASWSPGSWSSCPP